MTTKSNPFLALLSTMLILVGIAAGIFGYGFYTTMQPGPLNHPQNIVIERGMGTSAIAQKLENEGVISSALLFKIKSRLTQNTNTLKAGEYAFPSHISLQEVITMLREGDVFERSITVREGLTSHQVVQVLNKAEALSGEIMTIPPEGSLLPETYQFIIGDTKQQKLDRMRDAMTRTIEELWPNRGADLPFETKEDAITLASIIEKETGIAGERAKVAGVFINRLRIGMPLQTDPTVIYAITKGVMKDNGKGPLGRRLLRKDLDIDDPYNTYKNAGLPPGPIANPGRASIAAALNPAKHNYLYFVADGSGGHAFGKNLAEHNRNVAKWRKIRSQQ